MRHALAATAAVLLAAACGTAKVGPKPIVDDEVKETVKGDEIVREYDLDHSGRADVKKFFKKLPDPSDPKKTIEVLQRKELDLNRDGKTDMWVWYADDGETAVKQALDLDFDGKVDVVDYFEKGVIVKKDVFHAFSDKPDEWKYYEKGKLARVERDVRHKGQVDYWEYWEGDHIDRIGEDTDGDGQVDKWTKVKAAE